MFGFCMGDLTMFPWSPGEFKTKFVISEARAFQIRSQNFDQTRSTKNNLLLHNDTVGITVVCIGGLTGGTYSFNIAK